MSKKVLARGIAWLAAVAAGFAASAARGESYAVDPVHSSVLFRIKHMGTSYAWGRFNGISGTMSLEDNQPALDVKIKADSIDTANALRDNHLKGPDFFNVKQFPTIAFRGTRVRKVGDATYEIDGTLNLHGTEKPLSVKLEKTGTGKNQKGGTIAGFETTFEIKRSDFGMKYLLEGLEDKVLLVVSLECAQQ